MRMSLAVSVRRGAAARWWPLRLMVTSCRLRSSRTILALNLGAIGVTGTFAANRAAKTADLVIGIGTRYSDFTTASKSAFQDPNVRFVNLNVTAFDAGKHRGLPLIGDARATLEELAAALAGHAAPAAWRTECERLHVEWEAEVDAAAA